MPARAPQFICRHTAHHAPRSTSACLMYSALQRLAICTRPPANPPLPPGSFLIWQQELLPASFVWRLNTATMICQDKYMLVCIFISSGRSGTTRLPVSAMHLASAVNRTPAFRVAGCFLGQSARWFRFAVCCFYRFLFTCFVSFYPPAPCCLAPATPITKACYGGQLLPKIRQHRKCCLQLSFSDGHHGMPHVGKE